MKKIIRAYYYVFYKLHKFWDYVSVPKFWSEWKASLSMDILEIFYILSFINYYTIITENSINLGNGKLLTLIVVLFISITNYFIFNHKNQWEDIIAEFDELPRRKNKNWELASIRNCFIDNF